MNLVRIRWLNSRFTYVMCAPLLTVAGAATTIIAPMLLDTASFTQFALLNSLFTYLSEFDFGLARLSDRLLPCQTAAEAAISVGQLLFARYCAAGVLLVVTIGLGMISDPLMLVAGAGGIAMLIGNGPLSFYRSRSDISAFAFAGLLLQFGMTLPRLSGLLVDGVTGCMVAVGLWTGVSCIVLNAPLLSTVRCRFAEARRLIVQAVPLFIYSALWLLYLYANRWIASWISNTAVDAGLFAFGANLTVVVVGIMTILSQPYYPRHLADPVPERLARELYLLLALGALGCVLGDAFCRWALAIIFPHFAEAASVTAALVVTIVPLSLSAWLVPLVIARADRHYEVLVLPACLLAMYGLMAAGNQYAGINGQAWACLPPALLIFAAQLALVVRKRLLCGRDAIIVWTGCMTIVGMGLVGWLWVFR